VDDFRDALYAVRAEIRNMDIYQIRQKLEGGLLQVYIEAVDSPAFASQVQWSGGVLNPKQLARLGEPFQDLLQKVEANLEIYPSADIEVGKVTKDQKKLLPTKAFQIFLMTLEKQQPISDLSDIPKEGGMARACDGRKYRDQYAVPAPIKAGAHLYKRHNG